MMTAWPPSKEEKQDFYKSCFSMSYFSTNIESKFMLICLTCIVTELTNKTREKKNLSKVDCYAILKKIGPEFPDDVIVGLGIICDDYMRENMFPFPNFGVSAPKDMVKKIKEVLDTYLPF